MGDDDTETEAEGNMTHENDNIDNEKDDNETERRQGTKLRDPMKFKVQCCNKPHDTYTKYSLRQRNMDIERRQSR